MDAGIRKFWRETLITPDTWNADTRLGLPIRGEAKGLWVRSTQSDLLAYLKPTKKEATRYRAAYEKIAADLAFEIGVNVPPVVLYSRTAPANEEQHVALSLAPVGDFQDWKTLLHGASETRKKLLRHILREACESVALDAWLGNDDRHNTENSLVAFDEDPAVFLLDFANTMNYKGQWDTDGFKKIEKPRLPLLFAESLARERVFNAARVIVDLPSEAVNNIILRIPEDYMPRKAREEAAGQLCWRKQVLCDNFDSWYPGK